MNKTIRRHGTLLLFLTALGHLSAQMLPADAQKLRLDMATAVLTGTEKADAAVVRLTAAKGASGMNLEAHADLAIAAVDIGRRLLVKNKSADAIIFFKAAEIALDALVKVTPDSRAAEKADYLQRLAYLRGQYLSNDTQAKLDIEQAIALRPDDASIRRMEELIGNEHGKVFSVQPPKG